ncbi:MAG: phosphatase PAP2 family protein [bacterium]
MRRNLAQLALYRRNLDRWTVVYLVTSAFYPLLRPAVAPNLWAGILTHAGLALAVWYLPPLMRRSRHVTLRLIGEIYLPFIFPLFYREMEYLGIVFLDFDASFDPWFISLEETLFGGQLSLVWSSAWPWPWFHELMEFAYFSYYLISLVVLILIWRCRGIPDGQRWNALQAFVWDLGATMLICYSLYIFFPVWGPKYFQAGPVEVPGWIFTRIMEHIHVEGAILGAAFPSSHVAATLVPWWHVWKWFPQHRWWMTVLFGLLCAATVYCRYHYVVDVIGGLLLGSLILWAGGRHRETVRQVGNRNRC